MERWLQITVPLTTVTLLIAWLAYRLSGNAKRDPHGAVRDHAVAAAGARRRKQGTPATNPGTLRWEAFLRRPKIKNWIAKLSSWKEHILPLYHPKSGGGI